MSLREIQYYNFNILEKEIRVIIREIKAEGDGAGGSVQSARKDHRLDQQRTETLKRHLVIPKLQKALQCKKTRQKGK